MVVAIEDEPKQSEPPRRRGWLWVVVIVAFVVIALLLLWLRGCAPAGTSSTGKTSTQSAASAADESRIALDDRVHAALHAQRGPKGGPLDLLVYIFQVSTAHGVGVSITLTPLSGADPKAIAAQCENAVMAAVSEVTSVTVVDANGTVVSSQKRK